MTHSTSTISLDDFYKKIVHASGATSDIMSMLSLVDKRTYIRIRADINAAIGVGDIENFNGFVEEDTEIGDITDTILYMLEQSFPDDNAAHSKRLLSVDEQRDFRDKLIKELDSMVERY